jgi:SAM-dependent methyltransferase
LAQDGFDAERVLGDAQAVSALSSLAGRLRRWKYENAVADVRVGSAVPDTRLALGYPVHVSEFSAQDIESLVRSGAADLDEGRIVARFTIFALNETLILVPKDGGQDPDRVYFGMDSLWLTEFVARITQGGRYAADLGSGAGTIAAAMSQRFEEVVATDVLPRTVACARLTLILNPRHDLSPGGSAIVTDVAAGLKPASFDLVTGNPPWVPDLDRGEDPGEARRIYAEGGATGFELPRRFIMEGASLLAPGGVMVMLSLDSRWANGERPLHAIARGLKRLGFKVSLAPTELTGLWFQMQESLRSRCPDLISAVHVALVVQRSEEIGIWN